MNLNPIKCVLVALLCSIAAACVTINVYFPEAAAEQAADRFIRDVIGSDAEPQASQLPFAPEPVAEPSNSLAAAVVDFFIPSAHAQSANIDIESPQINAIKSRMAQRHSESLAGWFDAGAIGLTQEGLIAVRDRSAVGLAERRTLEQTVAAENADRNAVYREIAVANGHPEWEAQIRQTFARRWIANARAGWYYQDASGRWQQA